MAEVGQKNRCASPPRRRGSWRKNEDESTKRPFREFRLGFRV